MRKIKFRGVNDIGDVFYFEPTRAIEEYFKTKGVAPDKIDLLVGYDSNGEEVYEGDELIYEDEDEEGSAIIHKAELEDSFVNDERWTLFKKRT